MTQDPHQNPPEGEGYRQIPPQGQPWGAPQQGQPYAQQPSPQAVGGADRTWMILAHLSAPIAFIISAGTLSVLGPLLIWIFFKDTSPAVRQAAAGAFNFNLSFWVLYWLGWLVAVVTLGIGFLVVLPFWLLIFVVAAYAHIKGALRAGRGETYVYPFQLRVLQ